MVTSLCYRPLYPMDSMERIIKKHNHKINTTSQSKRKLDVSFVASFILHSYGLGGRDPLEICVRFSGVTNQVEP